MATDNRQALTVSCPTCGNTVEWTVEQRWRPFCSERCKLIDLGTWFDESNRIPDDSESLPVQGQDD